MVRIARPSPIVRTHARKRRLIIMVKEPLPGRVKTRLGAGIGMGAAARWFRRQSAGLVRRMSADSRWETWLAVSPDRAGMESRVWPHHIRRAPQRGGDLGARMGRLLRAFPPGPVIIIGADIPGVQAHDIAAAFKRLGDNDAVFGPAKDGGFWLVGLARGRRRWPTGLFDGVRWSTETTLADTVASLPGARIGYVRTLRDVDTVDDLGKM